MWETTTAPVVLKMATKLKTRARGLGIYYNNNRIRQLVSVTYLPPHYLRYADCHRIQDVVINQYHNFDFGLLRTVCKCRPTVSEIYAGKIPDIGRLALFHQTGVHLLQCCLITHYLSYFLLIKGPFDRGEPNSMT